MLCNLGELSYLYKILGPDLVDTVPYSLDWENAGLEDYVEGGAIDQDLSPKSLTSTEIETGSLHGMPLIRLHQIDIKDDWVEDEFEPAGTPCTIHYSASPAKVPTLAEDDPASLPKPEAKLNPPSRAKLVELRCSFVVACCCA